MAEIMGVYRPAPVKRRSNIVGAIPMMKVICAVINLTTLPSYSFVATGVCRLENDVLKSCSWCFVKIGCRLTDAVIIVHLV